MVRDWVRDSPQDLVDSGAGIQPGDVILQGIEAHLADSQRLATGLYTRWIEAL